MILSRGEKFRFRCGAIIVAFNHLLSWLVLCTVLGAVSVKVLADINSLSDDQAITAAKPKKIIMAVSASAKPFIFNNDKGLIADIVKEAFAYSGYQVQFIRYDNRTAIEQLNFGNIDAIAIANSTLTNAYLSESYITYNNMAITLADNNFKIDHLGDLSGKRVAAFLEARKYLGNDYAAKIATFKSYFEVSQQSKQVEFLFDNTADVIISDRYIFKYNLQQLYYKSDSSDYYLRKIKYYPIFPASDYRAAFNNPKLRDLFNKGLKHLRDTGRIKKLEKFYELLLHQLG